jgi:hypothetical protein
MSIRRLAMDGTSFTGIESVDNFVERLGFGVNTSDNRPLVITLLTYFVGKC